MKAKFVCEDLWLGSIYECPICKKPNKNIFAGFKYCPYCGGKITKFED